MHRLILLLTTISLHLIILQGQPSKGFYYQAALRNTDGTLMDSQLVGIKINFRSNTPDGVIVYSEVHITNTSPFGIVNLLISSGAVVEGSYDQIQWGSNTYYLELIINNTNTNTYNNSLGISQIVAVPVANYAHEAGNVNNNDTLADNELQHFELTLDSLKLSNVSGGIALEQLADQDADPTNELQDIYIEDNQIKLTNSTGSVPLDPVWDSDANTIYTTNQTLAIGSSTEYEQGNSLNGTMLTIRNTNNATVSNATQYGIHTKLYGQSSALDGEMEAWLGWIGAWDSGTIVGVGGRVNDISLLGRDSPSGEAYCAGGQFLSRLDNLSFSIPSNGYVVTGVSGTIKGTVANYPDVSKICGIYGRDEIETDSTYAGYLDGKLFTRDNAGFGIKNPQRTVHIKDVMRLEPRSGEPLNPQKGDMYFDDDTNKLRVFDGDIWQDCF